ncbi:UNVERIFIED_CONTAM: putative pectinesterase/pectinesterase inhibitor 28 [Sesamum calycinum]|uniref:Pectinesterase n=1 Tax=Sesamum calycinum TaxID=2727403 RepID=A0AAW2QJX2_9LAMI
MAAKAAVAGLAAILVVAMVVAVAVGVTRKQSESSSINAGSTKAVQSICAPTDYIDTCEKSLSDADTTDPKELIKAAFEFTEKNIGDVIKNSPLFKEAASDDSTKQALAICQEVLDTAIDDLKRSFDKVGEFDASKANEYLEDLKTWLSAVITNHETCIDAFENTTGDTGEKMKNVLQTARQMSSNGLAMVSNMSSIFTSLQTGSAASRKLLSEEEADLFISKKQRSLLALQPNAVVAQDGSGQFKTISAAIASVPQKNNQMFVIHVKAGVYKESVEIPKKVNKIVLIGDGPLKTRITGRKNYAEGVKTFHTATVAVNADEFMAKDIGIENTAGPLGHQAVALRVSGDRAIFHNVHIDGYQDTLYAHTYRQYYRDCSISGTIDFIFGDAQALFQNCKFVVRKPGPNQACMVTAQGRVERHSLGATVIQNGDFVAEPALLQASPPVKVYLGRPWKMLSRTIIMQSNIGGFVAPEGWSVWQGTFALDTLYYAEYQNRGPGSDQKSRVAWKGINTSVHKWLRAGREPNFITGMSGSGTLGFHTYLP